MSARATYNIEHERDGEEEEIEFQIKWGKQLANGGVLRRERCSEFQLF